jgi:hypothetical protein
MEASQAMDVLVLKQGRGQLSMHVETHLHSQEVFHGQLISHPRQLLQQEQLYLIVAT